MRSLAILGSTGSIGTQTLDICRELPELFQVTGLSCDRNIELLEKQIREFRPKVAAVKDEKAFRELQKKLKGFPVELFSGEHGQNIVACMPEADTLVAAIVGMAGLAPVYQAIEKGKRICLANKEVLVSGGNLVMKKVTDCGGVLLPVDSEHSAIFQSLAGDYKNIEKLIITASGGPFLGMKADELKKVRLEDALKHPNWTMGRKITIDSASLMNKGLEVIEARWLFNVKPEDIDVVVHKESIIHSMVQFRDGSVIGQMGLPDMKLPIRYALSWPNRLESKYERLDLKKIGNLTFQEPDRETFRCLELAYDSLRDSDGACVVLNGANEAAVEKVLSGEMDFWEIPYSIEKVLNLEFNKNPKSVDEIIELDRWARKALKPLNR